MRIVTWNLNNRNPNQAAWDALLELEPDIALLSEVNFVPEDLDGYNKTFEQATGPDGSFRNFSTGILSKGEIGESISLRASQPWVNAALDFYPGNVVGRMIRLPDDQSLPVFSIHMPSWQIPYQQFTDGDVSDVMLPDWPRLYLSELLWAALQNSVGTLGAYLIVGGDFNTSETIGETALSR